MPIGSFEADDEPVKAPYVEPGDCWSYHAEGLFFHGWINDYELCVTSVDKSKNLVLAVATVKADGREIDTAFSLDWATYADVTGRTSREGIRVFRFPLRVGDEYLTESEILNSFGGVGRVQRRLNIRIAGWEDITVPAGKFRTLRVEVKGTNLFTGLERAQPFTQTWWYAPEVNRHVKYVYDSGRPLLHQAEELTGYRLNK